MLKLLELLKFCTTSIQIAICDSIFGNFAGAAFAHLQMMNKKSRPLVTRAFYASGTGLDPIFYPWRRPNQLQQMKTCFQFSDTAPLIDYLRTANSSTLARCKGGPWMPVIENKMAPQAFLTDEPENILKSSDAPVIDAVFSFTSQVFQRERETEKKIRILMSFLNLCNVKHWFFGKFFRNL